MIIKIKNKRYFKTVMFFVYEWIYLLFIDAFNQYLLTRSFDISNYLINNLVVFNIVWILLFFIFLYVLKPKARKVIIKSVAKTDFSKYKLAKAFIRWSRDHSMTDLQTDEIAQAEKLIEKINKALQ